MFGTNAFPVPPLPPEVSYQARLGYVRLAYDIVGSQDPERVLAVAKQIEEFVEKTNA